MGSLAGPAGRSHGRLRRVVVTGLGAVTSLGLDVESSWSALLAGRSGVAPIASFDASALPVRFAGEVKGFDPLAYMDRRTARRSGRFAQLALAAARQALAWGELDPEPDVTGAVVATSGGIWETGAQERRLQEGGAHSVDPLLVPRVGAHMAAARIGLELGLRGPNTTVNSACASGADAIGQAFNLIRLGQAEAMLAGGSDTTVAPLAIAALARLGALSRRNDEPERASRPFDAGRDGFVLAEGAGILLLESEEYALRRGAPILAELAGAGWSFDAADDTAPDAEGQALAMRRALADAGADPAEVGFVKAHGTSTELNDAAESRAIRAVFGAHADGLPVTSFKGAMGHAACAAGAVEAVFTVLALARGLVPPTANYELPDPACDVRVVAGRPLERPVEAALANAFGMGGQNTSLLFRRYRPGS
ncbi:MAG: beta-ketoacyl-[acyl-carrier-protein] synthase family protein [Bacillota bacterium]|nr:beta-ketoacyl-[acyl-carrier-protein] synthase family protein [Bacillota bacterium]